ncbi:prevent-host-death family protein [Arboricoccus pini]|uniref:Antitoxin n=1 Tax=Arboricoccus pini TaxID=1963835 RepID=A0A212RRA0_9PROT|nr:type II toxin-antitoxin system prevent-host-death family antitoxin [Arboricoccus pini]SNB75003.1 prevent-host-death family protein [Arboricoccus pini]
MEEMTVGAFEAKTHLSALLERVARGEAITITRHGRPVARLVPAVEADRARISQAIDGLKTLRREARLDGLSWRDLRDEGRR